MDIFSPVKSGYGLLLELFSKFSADDDDLLRLKHYLVFTIIGVPTMLVFGLYNFLVGNIPLVLCIIFLCICLLIGGVVQFRYPKTRWVYRFCGLIYASLLLYMFSSYSEGGSKALWLYTFPLIVFFLMGKREGAIWVSILLFAAIALFFSQLSFLYFSHYSGSFLVRLLAIYVIISSVTYWFENFRNRYYVQVQESHRRIEEILDNSRDILYRRDLLSGQYQYLSPAFLHQLGYSQNEATTLQEDGIEKLIHPDDRQKHHEVIRELMQDQRERTVDHVVEYRMRKRDGTYLWFSDKVAVVRNADGMPEYLIGSSREITSVRSTRKALEKAYDQLYAILNSIEAHVYVADMQSHRILFMNNKMQLDYGQNFEGEYCWKEIMQRSKACDDCVNSKLLDGENNATGVHEWEIYNAKLGKWFNNYDRAIEWIDGRWVRLQIGVDITRIKEMEKERKRTEEIVRRAENMAAIGHLAGGIAHDFNNLLQVIRGNLNMVSSGVKLEEKALFNLDESDRAVLKAMELAKKLITFSSGGEPIKEATAFLPLLQKVIQDKLKQSSIHHSLNTDVQNVEVALDSTQMEAALGHLIQNGIESMEEDGEMEISVERCSFSSEHEDGGEFIATGDYLKIAIRDSGVGIAQKELSRIFDPYYSTKKMGEDRGVGLGLSMAYSIIKKHDGYITVRSTPNRGTVVTLFLPVAEGKSPGVEISGELQAKEIPALGGKVLVMDDEQMMRDLMINMFAGLGVEIKTVADGNEACEVFKEAGEKGDPYRLVILDLTVPHGMGGMETFAMLRSYDPEVRVVVSSGYSVDPILAQYEKHGFVDVLMKPFSLNDLEELLIRQRIIEGS